MNLGQKAEMMEAIETNLQELDLSPIDLKTPLLIALYALSFIGGLYV